MMAKHQWAWQCHVLQDIRFYFIPKAKKKDGEKKCTIYCKNAYIYFMILHYFSDTFILFPASVVSLEITTLKYFKY